MNGQGFTTASWSALPTFTGRCANPHDVDAGAAVFALGDTWNGRVMAIALPQPVIWWNDDEECAAVAVQAEAHETEDGDTMEVLGLVLPTGRTVVSLYEDVDEVDSTDPVWAALVEDSLFGDEDEYQPRAAEAEGLQTVDVWDDDEEALS
jgi:hypothetical protein